jgi:hypothetical protein
VVLVHRLRSDAVAGDVDFERLLDEVERKVSQS